MPLKPLPCPNCSAPVALSDENHTTCASCGTLVEIPTQYQNLRKTSAQARMLRQKSEAQIQKLIDESLPPAYRIYAGTFWILGAIAVPILFAYHGPWSPRVWVVFAGLTPSVLLGYVCMLVINKTLNPKLYLNTLSVQLLPRFHNGQLQCGNCEAPLSVEPEARAATCDYCHSDSWVLSPETHNPARARERHAQNLSGILSVHQYRKFEIKVFHISWWVIWILVLVGLWFFVPRDPLL